MDIEKVSNQHYQFKDGDNDRYCCSIEKELIKISTDDLNQNPQVEIHMDILGGRRLLAVLESLVEQYEQINKPIY